MTTAALYFRQSLNVQEGIDRQRTRCQALASERGWDVAGEYVDNDVSATKARGAKTAWGRMLADAKAGKFEVIVAVDLDRLLRTMGDLITLVDIGVKVTTVDGEIDLSTADGVFRGTMLAAVAAFEVKRKSERQERAQAVKTAAGVPRMGKRAFGWEADLVTPRESEAKWVRYAHAELINGGSRWGIVRHFNEKGVKSSQGSEWTPAMLKAMLTRPRNAGILIANGAAQEKSLIAPLVTMEEHKQVLALYASTSVQNSRGPKVEKNWLTGLMHCGECGAVMRGKKITAKGERAAFYVCETTIKRTAGGVRMRSIRASKAEELVPWEVFVVMLSADPARYEQDDQRAKVGALSAELHDLSEQRKAAQELYLLPGADKGYAAQQMATIAAQMENVEQRLLDARAASVGLSIRDLLEQAGATELTRRTGMQELYQHYERFEKVFTALDIEQRRELVRTTVRITINGGKNNRLQVESLI